MKSMKEQKLLKEYNKLESKDNFASDRYGIFVPYINSYCSGEGMIAMWSA